MDFVYLIRPAREGFKTEPTAEEMDLMGKHFAYLKQALDRGQLVLAGPCVDRSLGIAVFRADDRAAAEKFMNEDPAIKSGVMKAELKEFRAALLGK